MDPFKRLGERLIEHRVLVLVVIGTITAFCGYHALHLRLRTNYRSQLPRNHPYIKVHDEYAASFGGASSIVIMIEVKEGSIFTVDNLNRIWRMTKRLDHVFGVNRDQVESIAHPSVRHLKVAAGGTMRAQPVMPRPVTGPEEA